VIASINRLIHKSIGEGRGIGGDVLCRWASMMETMEGGRSGRMGARGEKDSREGG